MYKRKLPPAARITGWALKKSRLQAPSSLVPHTSFARKLLRRKFWAQVKHTIIARPLKNFGTQYMPNQFMTRFVYTIDFGMTIGAGSITGTSLFRGNSIYDPDYSGVGTRAMGASEMSSIYDNYRVISSRITCAVSGKTVSNPIRFTVYPTRDTAAPTQAIALSHPNAVRCHIAEALECRQVQNYCRTNVLYAVKKLDDVAFGSAMNANPTNAWYWAVMATGSQDDQVSVCCTIEYYTILYNLKTTYQAAL